MFVNGVEVEDTFCEAFDVYVSRVVITAYNHCLAEIAAKEACGFATSMIMCPAEAGVEKTLSFEETPDGRAGISILISHTSKKALKNQLIARIGQCVLTAPTANAFDGLESAEDRFDIGNKLRYFGDGYEREVEVNGRKCWAIPVMEGEFVVENDFGVVRGVAGGNVFIMGVNQPSALSAAMAGVNAVKEMEGVITPFPGGIVASGSKVGANRYRFLKATTNEKYVPSLRGVVDSEVPEGVGAVYEIVINGLSEEVVAEAIRRCILAATRIPGVVKITAGNYGGKLGKYRIYLKDLF